MTLHHEPVDYAGQSQKTTATLAGRYGTYDILETYGFVVPQQASTGKLHPLDDLMARYGAELGLDRLNPEMREALSYDGKLYGIPMQAQTFVMAYRRDVFDRLGITRRGPSPSCARPPTASSARAGSATRWPCRCWRARTSRPPTTRRWARWAPTTSTATPAARTSTPRRPRGPSPSCGRCCRSWIRR